MRPLARPRVESHIGRTCALCLAAFVASSLVPPPTPCWADPPEGSGSDVFDDTGDGPAPAAEEPPADGAVEDMSLPEEVPAEPPPEDAPATRALTPATAPKRLRVPPAAAIADAEQLVREAFGDARATRGQAERLALAKKLLEQAGETAADEPAARYVLLREARDLAAAAGDVGVSMSAAEELVAAFRVKRAATKLAALPPTGKAAGMATDAAELARVLVAISNDGIAEEDWAAATKAASLAAVAAGRVREDKALALRARAQPGVVTRSRKLASAAADARKKLDADPKDPEANLLLGRYLCFIRGNWAAGVRHLAKSGDPALKDLARRELSDPKGATEMAALAHGWWSAAEKAAKEDAEALRARAAHWYHQALPDLEGMTKSLAEKRLSGVQRDAQVSSANLLLRMRPQDCTAKRVRDGVALTEGDHGRIVTTNEFSAPLTIEIAAKTVGGSMRLYAGERGIWILNWEDGPTQLRFGDLMSGQHTGLPGKGGIPNGEWVAVRWVIDADQTSLFVDGELRARIQGDYSKWSGVVGIGPSQGSTVTVRSVTVTAAPAPQK